MKNADFFFNRELSWLEFNYRVLEEGLDKSNPLLERLKFLSIFSNNLDEFFMVRISGLISQVKSDFQIKDMSGQTPGDILSKINLRVHELVKKQYECFNNDIIPEMRNEGFNFYTAKTIPEMYLESLKNLFLKKHFLILTPMAVDQSHPFPFLSGKSLNILVKIEDPKKKEIKYAIIPYPTDDRFILISDDGNLKNYIFVGELIKLFVSYFFRGYNVLDSAIFRITRDAELSIDEEGAEDLLLEIEGQLKKREKGRPIRLECQSDTSEDIKSFLKENINFYEGFFFDIEGPIDLSSFMQIATVRGYQHLKDVSLPPILPFEFQNEKESIFSIIAKKDWLLSHPYESFDPVTRFIEEASVDPKVLAIKMTLYRTSGDSPIIAALKKAAENKKQVTVVVELKARFDEAQNINWAKQLEQVGCHVVYGIVGLKIHCKIALVVRDEDDGIKRYIHLSTGNYNDKTARIYTDLGLFTSKKSYGRDASAIFNLLTGYSEPPRWKKMVCAPLDMRNFFIDKITIEKNNALSGGKGKIIAKMNSLVDGKIIKELYEASKAGVEIQLVVRGMCCLKPSVKNLSENIKVISIVDRFLEHSRIFYFYNSGDENLYFSSADWMERNFDRRIETLFPIEDEDIKREVMNLMKITLSDNTKARILTPDGSYKRIKPDASEKKIRSQVEIYNMTLEREKAKQREKEVIKKFIPKKNPDIT
ncbi:MAG TPA: polyphosphate kinase 1 [Spirochaetota bacterium]|nr:polyphosphate kinase 1 [Spirochaetota bacterium]HOS54527.1 polyphosphate kinase 1 [Spirochaetota bacterium]HPK60831.1 polyphosphate kinase 1 [Spirochaetota bacterium]HQF77169.1 polyphosphate kinase 1 [Spirochaetota bacterium]HQH29606.1 polyphosphate kinase 1 [Spirochaetota bacterium]